MQPMVGAQRVVSPVLRDIRTLRHCGDGPGEQSECILGHLRGTSGMLSATAQGVRGVLHDPVGQPGASLSS
jgi:hypothetical protein